MATGRTRGELDTDRQLNLSLVRLLEIVGEAAGRVPVEERVRHRDIPWPEIVCLRNRLIHGYDSVDFDVLWRIVSDDGWAMISTTSWGSTSLARLWPLKY